MIREWTAAALLVAAGAASATPQKTTDPDLGEIVVTASRMHAPVLVVTDPKAPRQPLPAHDGADYLKTIPGFSVIRKGGTDGDPVFRGMAASRVNILLDGEQVLGGCGMRMDPPTAYVFPEAYDQITVVKGPQTVLYGPGSSSATVRFERQPPSFDEPGLEGDASLLGASFGRTDLMAELRGGTRRVYGQLTGTHAESGDYQDGAGDRVHSAYQRWSVNGAIGFTPAPGSRFELSGAVSNGEAAYADRAMDGVLFDRENLGFRLEREFSGDILRGLEAQAYYNYIDHVMDNYSLRDFQSTMMMPGPTASNPDRRTTGGRLAFDLGFAADARATVGMDLQENQHRIRGTGNEIELPYEQMRREDDAWFRNTGVFVEVTLPRGEQSRVVAGLRADRWRATDERESLAIGMSMQPNPTAGESREAVLPSGFLRYEHDLSERPVTAFAGLGHVQRFPDYWELFARKEAADSLSAFHTRPEKTTQFDTGIVFLGTRSNGSISAFFNEIDDYILIESGYQKGMRQTTITRNVNARTWGGEADASYALTPSLNATGTLAFTRGDNLSDDRPLAQMPPLEFRAALDYTRNTWAAGALWRLVAAQDRYAINQGNVVGQDLGPSGGFGVLSFNGSWRLLPGMLLSAGVDNLFDKVYAEHLSRSGSAVAGYTQTTRVNEPGRTLWLKFSASFE
jgi:iron complex outermembrane receptor protein